MKRVVAIGVVVVVCSFLVGAAAGTVAVVRGDDDRIEVLGSGDAVSVLITSKQSRLLIATGDDRAGFGNALDRAIRGPGSDPDIVVIAGAGRDLTVPAQALDLGQAGRVYASHPLDADGLGDPRLAGLSTFPANPVRITLADHLMITVEWVAEPADGRAYAWRAVVALDSTRVAIVSEGQHLPRFDWSNPVGALVIAGELDDAEPGQTGARSIIASASTLDPDEAGLERRSSQTGSTTSLVPVRPGDIATLTFNDGAIRLTSDGEIAEIVSPGEAEESFGARSQPQRS